MESRKITLIHLLLCCLACSGLVGGIAYYWNNNSLTRVAYVDTNILLDSYQAMITARHQYSQEKREWERNLAILAAEAHQADSIQQGRSINKLADKRSVVLKRQQFINYQQAVYTQDPREMQRLTKPVIESANHFIATYSREHHYNLVLTSAGQGDVLFIDKKMDVTSDVLMQLNKALTDSLARFHRK